MKNIIISFLIFAILIITIFLSVVYINYSCRELITINNSVEVAINAEDWKLAKANTNLFLTTWDKHSNVISMFIHHQEIDNICMEISKEKTYVAERNTEETLSNISTINFLLEHIINMENLSIQNIF